MCVGAWDDSVEGYKCQDQYFRPCSISGRGKGLMKAVSYLST